MLHIPSCWGLGQLSGVLLNQHPSETYLYIYCYVTMSFYIRKFGNYDVSVYIDEIVLYVHWYSLIFRICSGRSHNLYQELAKQHGKYGNEVGELISRTKAPIGIQWFLIDVWCFFWWGSDDCVNLDGDVFRKMLVCRHQLTVDPMRLLGMWLGPQFAKRCSPRIWSWKNMGSASEMVDDGW